MSRERSGIFKFFYIVLSIVTFPIFAIIYILKHPLWFLFFVLLVLGVLIYFPMSDGVEFNGMVDWYKKKYSDVRLEVVTKAVESGKSSFVPKSIIDDVEKIKIEAEEEKQESLRVKGENYNDKIVRDKEFEDVAVGIKKKTGFAKKKKEPTLDDNAKSLVEEGEKAGGLSAILKNATKKTEEEKNEFADEGISVIGDVLDSLETDEDENENTKEDIEDIVEEAEDGLDYLKELEKVDEAKAKSDAIVEIMPDINNIVVELPVVTNNEATADDKANDLGELELF